MTALAIRHASSGSARTSVLPAAPTGLIEPMKFVAVAVAGKGHWIRGTARIVAAYVRRHFSSNDCLGETPVGMVKLIGQ